MRHISTRMLDRYAGGDSPEPDAWAVEAHLETCAGCRDRLSDAVARRSPQTTGLLARVRDDVLAELPANPQAPVRPFRRWRWWATPALWHRLAMTGLVMAAAIGLDLVDSAGRFPSLVLLLAPVAPLLAVAAAWSRGLDPAYELVGASPRAGLDLVLRRTLAVLAVVIPVLAAAGWVVGASPARWLLPCLAFTLAALALGELVGLHRAATGLALGWVAVVVGPSLVWERTPVLLAPESRLGWAVVAGTVAVALVVRRKAYAAAYTALASWR